MRTEEIGRFAGRLARAAGKEATKRSDELGKASTQWVPHAEKTGRKSARFVKHVVPAVAKPIHALWHQLLGYCFLAFAALGAWKVWRNQAEIPPILFVGALIFIIVTAAYGVSSILKSQRISRG